MPKIEFLRDYTVQDGSGTSYKKGQVVELSDASAQHFMKRGAAALQGKAKRGRPKKEEAVPASSVQIKKEEKAVARGPQVASTTKDL